MTIANYPPVTTVESLRNDQSGEPEVSYVDCLADAAVFEKFTLQAVTAMTQAHYFYLRDSANAIYAAWIDIDADGTAPTGVIYASATHTKKVSILSGDTAAQIAGKIKTALEGDVNFTSWTIGISTDTLTFTSTKLGNRTDGGAKTANDSGNSTKLLFTTTVTGVASSLQNKYIQFRKGDDDSKFHAWFNVNSEGADPAPSASTAIAVPISGAASAAAVATALKTAVDANAHFEAKVDGTRVQIATSENGNTTDISAGNAGFTVSNKHDGSSHLVAPGDSVSSLTNF